MSKTDENVGQISKLFHENMHNIIHSLANKMVISFASCKSVLTPD
jgi:hypothetical protein